MKKQLLTLLLFFSFSFTVHSQGSIHMTEVYCDTVNYWQDVLFMPDGSYYMAGYKTDSTIGLINYNSGVMGRFTKNHQLVWTKYFGGSKEDLFRKIKRFPDGRILLMGETNSRDGDINADTNIYKLTAYDAWLCITDSNGNLLHTNIWGYGDQTIPRDCHIASNGDIFFVGLTYAYNADFVANNTTFTDQTWVALADSQLNKKWLRMFLAPTNNIPDLGGGVLDRDTLWLPIGTDAITGDYNISPPPFGAVDAYFFCIDTNMNISNALRKGGTGNEGASISAYNPNSQNHVFLVSTVFANDGDFYVPSEVPAFVGDYYTLCSMNKQGAVVWKHAYGLFDSTVSNIAQIAPRSMTMDHDGNIWIAHSVNGNDTHWIGPSVGPIFNRDIWILKFDSLGILMAKLRFGTIGEEDPISIKVNEQNEVFIVARIAPDATYDAKNPLSCATDTTLSNIKLYKVDYWPQSVKDTKKEINKLTVFPNPSSGIIRIELPNANKRSSIRVYSSSGKRIYKQRLSATAFYDLDMSTQPNGTYKIICVNNNKKYFATIILNK